ncbi:MAG: GNAT family N-acetyltransferase [Acidobacteria bacterium]|nr:GNAT family N-acetyltransferase [Acidobacteriota bacterium]
MPLFDWRDLDPDLLNEVWAEQEARWSERLCWDSRPNWTQVEQERASGRLPGLALVEGRRVTGWCFFLVHQDTLQIGGFEAESSAATRTLLDGVLHMVDPHVAPSGAMLFAFSGAPGLAPALAARGFDIEPYLYLVRDLASAREVHTALEWNIDAAAQLPVLLAAAYGEPSPARPFARHGLMTEWREYAAQLLGSTACGWFEPALSAASFAPDGRLEAAVVTTMIRHDTAHIAQVAVDPGRRGGGMATSMLQAVCARAHARKVERLSLLVSERNLSARRLYDHLGFHETASFTAAGRAGSEGRSRNSEVRTGQTTAPALVSEP